MITSYHKSSPLAKLSLSAVLSALTIPFAGAADLYWDANGTAAGAGAAPSGIWGGDNFWGTLADGTATPGSYVSGSDVIFAAGLDSTDPYAVTLNGNQAARSITFQSPGEVTLSGSELQLGAGGISANSNATIASVTRMTSNQTWDIAAGKRVTQSGNLLGAFSLTKTGSGTLVIGGAGTAFTSLRISEGRVNVTGAGILGLSTQIILEDVAGAELDFTGAVGSKGFGSLSGGGANGGNIIAATTISFYGAAGVTGDYSGIISGNGGFSILSAGQQTLRGANTYRGATSISRGGTLVINSIRNVNGGASSLGAVTTVAAGTITFGLAADTLASTLRYIGSGHSSDREFTLAGNTAGAIIDASGTGALKLSGKFNATGAGSKTLVLTGSNTDDNTLSGVISDNSTVNKTGITKKSTGTWILGGNNVYTGATIVEAGKLIVNGSTAAGSNVTVAAGATLGGSGTIGGATLVDGTLAPGSGLGTLNTGALTFASTSTLEIEFGRTGGSAVSDLVNVTGGVTIHDGANLNFTLSVGTAQAGDLFFLIINDGIDAINGEFTHFNGVATPLMEGSVFEWNSEQWTITYQADYGSMSFTGGNDIALQMVIPEPGTLALLTASSVALALCRRRPSKVA